MAISVRRALPLLIAAGLAGCGDTTIVQPTKTVIATPAPLSLATYRVPSGSMEPTLPIGTHVFVRILGYTPKVGDIVVFHPPNGAVEEVCGPSPHTIRPGGAACDAVVPEEASVKFIKRIVAGPGDEIYIREGHVYRKPVGEREFTRESDAYIRPCAGVAECNFPTPITIPAGYWFMMGDNRGESDDSRFYGPVSASWIEGGVVWCTAVGHPCPPG